LFKGYSKEKLRDIYDDCNNTGIEFETFYRNYLNTVIDEKNEN
jgi:hypothetical protein